MVAILQIDLLQYSLYILAVILGFFSASAANIIKDCVDRHRLRKALYIEIIATYEILKATAGDLKSYIDDKTLTDDDFYRHFKDAYLYLQMALSADTYSYAKATPSLFRGVKDATSIDEVYFTFRLFEIVLKVWNIENTSPQNSREQAERLKAACDEYLGYLDGQFMIGTLDKKMLLKAVDSSVLALAEYWEKLLKEPSPDAQQPKAEN